MANHSQGEFDRIGAVITGEPAPAPSAATAAERFSVLESCRSTWLFDESDHLFCRIPKSEGVAGVPSGWLSYERLVTDTASAAFVVVLDAAGSRVVRAFRHEPGCVHCGGDVTSEVSLEEIRRLIGA